MRAPKTAGVAGCEEGRQAREGRTCSSSPPAAFADLGISTDFKPLEKG